MLSIRVLLSALTLTLLAVAVESWSDGYLSGAELTRLYNSPVHLAERMRRPKGSSSSSGSLLTSHTGVRVTIDDGTQWLVHKGLNYGVSSDTVVTRAADMSSAWEVIAFKDFEGRKTVGDFVRTGGTSYNLLWSNCHIASRRMMNQ